MRSWSIPALMLHQDWQVCTVYRCSQRSAFEDLISFFAGWGGVEKNCDCLAHHRPHVTASSHRATVSCSPSMYMHLRFGSPSFNAHTFTRCTTQPACTLSLYLFTLFNLSTSNYYCSQVSPMLRRKQGPQDVASWKK